MHVHGKYKVGREREKMFFFSSTARMGMETQESLAAMNVESVPLENLMDRKKVDDGLLLQT